MSSVDKDTTKKDRGIKPRDIWLSFVAPVAVSLVISGGGGYLLLQQTQAVLGSRVDRAELDIKELRADLLSVRAENLVLRSEISKIGADVSWVRGRLEGITRLGNSEP